MVLLLGSKDWNLMNGNKLGRKIRLDSRNLRDILLFK